MDLREKIENQTAKVVIIGGGYVGLPLAVECAKSDFPVAIFDIDEEKIKHIEKNHSYIKDVPSSDLEELEKDGNKILSFYHPKTLEKQFGTPDIILICVPTPLNKRRDPDISYVLSAAEITNNWTTATKEQLVVLESTVYPGFSREILQKEIPLVKYLAFSPERVDPGNDKFNTYNTPKIVGGIDDNSTRIATDFYINVVEQVVPVSSCEAAETCKILENTFRMINIGLVNEMAIMCKKMGIDVWEVIRAASTKPFGFMKFTPGSGVGGHCCSKNEKVYYRLNDIINIDSMENIYNLVSEKDKLEILSFNNVNYEWKKVSKFLKRLYKGKIYKIQTLYGMNVSVTDKHPMLTMGKKQNLQTIFADEIKTDHYLPVYRGQPTHEQIKEENINMIDMLLETGHDIGRLRIKNKKFQNIRPLIYKKLQPKNKYMLRHNYLYLKHYLQIRHLIPKHIEESSVICSGRDPSYQSIPVILEINEDFCKLIGYYLSEGCITLDKSFRIRWSLGAHETEYINDIYQILNRMNIKYSFYRQQNTHHIKVSSNVLGIMFKDYLKLGKNCYEKSIPEMLFNTSYNNKMSLIGGMISGDGYISKRGHISYASVSENLIRGLIFLFQTMGIYSSFSSKQNKISNSLTHMKTAQKCYFAKVFRKSFLQKLDNKDLFGRKSKILKKALAIKEQNKEVSNRKQFIPGLFLDFFPVKQIEIENYDDYVYSLEVPDNQNFVLGNGILVHNCIPLDPHYLSWKMKSFGYNSKFIDIAEEINSSMPNYVISLAQNALNQLKKSINGSKILVVGAAYKSNIDDVRESPALTVMEELKKMGAEIEYYDPYVDLINMSWGPICSIGIDDFDGKAYDCSIIITDHDNIDYHKVVFHSKSVVDTRNALEQRGIDTAGTLKIVL